MFMFFEDVYNFVTGGKAFFTIVSDVTKKHFTYKVVKIEGTEDKFYVSVMRGTDNENSYSYIGLLNISNGSFSHTRNSKVSKDDIRFKAFDYFNNGLRNKKIANNLSFSHAGKCCKCGRKLTNPKSISTGIGPECSKR